MKSLMFLAAIGCCTAMPALADDDKRPTEVTITVVEDPEQLKEKINKIQLPEVHEEMRPVQKKDGKPQAPAKSSSSTGGQQRNESAAPHHDTNDKPIKPAKAEDERHHGESKLPH
jgi:hypothetical protein